MWSLNTITLSGGLVLFMGAIIQHAMQDLNSIPYNFESDYTLIVHVYNSLLREGLTTNLSPAQARALISGIESLADLRGVQLVDAENLNNLRSFADIARLSNGLPNAAVGYNLEDLVGLLQDRVQHGLDVYPNAPLIGLQSQLALRTELTLVTHRIIELGYADAERLSQLNPQIPFIVGINGGILQNGEWVGSSPNLALGINNLGTYFGSFLVEPIHNIRFNIFGLYAYFPLDSVSDVGTPLDQLLVGLSEVEATPLQPITSPVADPVVDPNSPMAPPIDDIFDGGGGESKSRHF